MTRRNRLAKRMIDFFVAVIGIILVLPIIIILAIIIRIFLGSPIFFKQKRPGLNEKLFELYKFRTMISKKDENGNPLPDEERLNRTGKIIRSLSLDEIPQLWNVLRGDLSLVGPRPLLVEYLGKYNEEQRRRHEVKPGITGWAQIKGRNALTWQKKFALDIWYVDNWSLFLDIKILLITIWKVIKREGISQDGHTTMTKFTEEGEK